MQAIRSFKYLAFAAAITLWGCSNQQYAQTGEYDDLYFSSKDKREVQYTASTANNVTYSDQNNGEAGEDYSQKDVNPDYIQQYAEDSRKNVSTGTDGNDSYSADENSYYDENYTRPGGINLARHYHRQQSGYDYSPAFNFYGYGGSGYNDPFFDPYWDRPYAFHNRFHDPFYSPFNMRSGIVISYGWGNPWGMNRWNRWNDPFYWNSPWAYRNAYNGWNSPWMWNDPFFSGYNPYYGYGNGYYNRPVVIVNGNNNGTNNPDNRTTRYSPRSGRGSAQVNDNAVGNSPRSSQGGRIGNTDPNQPNRGGRMANEDGTASPRAVRPRNSNPDYNGNTTQDDSSRPGGRVSSPQGAGNDSYASPRPVRPRGNENSGTSTPNGRTYGSGASDYSNNRSNSPSYNNTPRQRSGNDNTTSPAPRSSNWGNSRSNDTFRSNGGSNSSFGGSSSTPSSSPRSGGSSSGSSGGSSSPRSPRSPR